MPCVCVCMCMCMCSEQKGPRYSRRIDSTVLVHKKVLEVKTFRADLYLLYTGITYYINILILYFVSKIENN